ncbi:MAG: NF038132 family protein [Burkholderiaceae bacterium]
MTTATTVVPVSPLLDSTFGYLSTFNGLQGRGSLADVGVGKGNDLSSTSPPTGSSFTSGSFTAATDAQLSMNFNYVSLDGSGYSDYAWARLHKVGTQDYIWLFTAMSSSQGGKSVVPGKVSNDFDPAKMIADFGAVTFNGSSTSQISWAPLGGLSNCYEVSGSISKGCGSTGWLTSSYTFSAVTAGTYQLEMGVTNWGDNRFHSALAFDVQGMASNAPEPSTLAMMGTALALFGLQANRRRKQRSA